MGCGGEDGNEISVPFFSFLFSFGGERHKKKAKIIIILLIFLIEMSYGAPNEGDLK